MPVHDGAHIQRGFNIPLVSIVIINYNSADLLERCLGCILKQSLQDFECIIVDNNSQDESLAFLSSLNDTRIKCVKNDENLGFAQANNIGAKLSKAPWIACLNPDAFARPNWLETLLQQTQTPLNVTMVGSTQIMAEQSDTYDGTGDCYHVSGIAWRADYGRAIESRPPIQDCEVFAPCAAGALYHKETFLKLRGFDETFFCYHEDVDLGFRMRLDGGICIQSAGAIIDHMGSAISGKGSYFSVYHGTRNRTWTFFKNMPTLGLWLFTLPHIGLSLALLVWAAFRPGRFKPTWQGMLDGATGLPAIFKARREIQKTRKISALALFKMMAFDPRKFLTRALHSRPDPRCINTRLQ